MNCQDDILSILKNPVNPVDSFEGPNPVEPDVVSALRL